jgi:streptomycin 6-kinase
VSQQPVPVADPERFHERISSWGVDLECRLETETSLLGFGSRDQDAVVLKVSKRPDDEWRSGEVLCAYQGRGVVRVLEHSPGSLLMERLRPATPLTSLSRDGEDEEATRILARIISQMSPGWIPPEAPSLRHWGAGFHPYVASGHPRLPASLVGEANRIFVQLIASQRQPRLLHGDLHHYNVLFDQDRGWLAIDPKGVVGELEYEVGAALRNPCEHPDVFADPMRIRSRIECFTRELHLDAGRVAGWAFAQAVLALIWLIEDGSKEEPFESWLPLADTLYSMLPDSLAPPHRSRRHFPRGPK